MSSLTGVSFLLIIESLFYCVLTQSLMPNLRSCSARTNDRTTETCPGEAKQFAQALSVLTDLKNAGLRPNQITYSILLKACEK